MMKTETFARRAAHLRLAVQLGLVLPLTVLVGCVVGPKYSRPSTQVPQVYKEVPEGWKAAAPADQLARGKWWEIFHDPQLNALEEKVNVSNQSLKAAYDQFLQARALVRYFRADYYPTVTAGASGTYTRPSQNRPLSTTASTKKNTTDLLLPVIVSWEPDVFGRIRRTVEAARSNAQASAADVESVRLAVHAELASDYFQMRTLDAEEQLLQSTVTAYERALELTQNRHKGGVASAVDVAQAQTQLETTRAQATDIQVQRAQFEHAIAVLIGEPASTFTFALAPWSSPPPQIPTGLPSDLLERRPDIAGAERRMAAANAQIGVTRAAYFPSLVLTGSGGFESSSITTWLSGPSGFLSAGASAAVTAFDVGRRRAASEQARAAYDQSVANYRQTVLVSFQEVEDHLAALRILDEEARRQQEAVAAAERSLNLSLNRYRGGVTTYLEVTTAQGIALNNERTAVQILARRMTASVLLIQALGGTWDASQLPSGNLQSSSLIKGQ
jgi:NodT family efflux transporter outer membrane factor (OMF) lipoprotein